MNKQEIEQALLESDGSQALLETAKRLKEQATVPRPASQATAAVLPSPYPVPATPAEIAKTDLGTIRRRALVRDIGRAFPDLRDSTPLSALETLVKRLASSPSPTAALLVHDAINRIAVRASADAKDLRAVAKAVKVLSSIEQKNDAAGRVTDSIWANLYRHADFTGTSMFAWLGPFSLYQVYRQSLLESLDLHDRVSSLQVEASAGEARGDVLVFQDDRFFGRFTSIRTNSANPTAPVSVSYIGGYMNDKTSSVMLVRRYADETVASLGSLGVREQIRSLIEDIEDIRNLRGDPILTWDMWPSGGDEHPNDPDKRFIQVKIPVRVDVNNWFDYDAELWLWIYLYLSGGEVAGYVAYYGAWVESGIISGSVLEDVMDGLEDQIGNVNDLIATNLSLVNAGAPYSSVYLLPGNQETFSGSYLEGHVEDDVSIVLTKGSLLLARVTVAAVMVA